MKRATVTSVIAGASMISAFAISIYICLYDTTLAQEDPVHHEITWVIGIITLIAGIVLILGPRNVPWKLISGVIWPVLYLLSLAFDVETKLCFGTDVHCWPSVSDSYDYLILNERVEGWVLSQYTMRLLIGLLIATVFLAVVSILISIRSRQREKKINETEEGYDGGTEKSRKKSA